MKDKYHIISEYYDFTTTDQMFQYHDGSKVNEHANADLGWIEHIQRISIPKKKADLQLRWWEYQGVNVKKDQKSPLIICWMEYYNTTWQRIADREGLTVVAFEYHKNSRIPALGKGTLGFGPRKDEIETYHYVIEKVIEKYNCDRNRIYAMGLSYGDMTAMCYARDYGKTLSGIALMNGPSSYFSLDYFNLFNLESIPSIQMRSNDDFTCDGFPADRAPQFPLKGNEEFIRKVRSYQTVLNRDVWMKANGIKSYHPLITSDYKRVYAVYPGKNTRVIYNEMVQKCHIGPLDAAEIFWSGLFSRYKRDNKGKIIEIAAEYFEPDQNIAVAAGCDTAYINNEVEKLSCHCVVVEPPKELARDSRVYHKSEDEYSTIYAPVDILEKGFGISYSIEKLPDRHTNQWGKLSKAIKIDDSVIRFIFMGRKYEIYTDTTIAVVDGKIIDVDRPPLTINNNLMIPIEEVAHLLGLWSSRNNDTVYITDHEMYLGYTMGRLIKEEILTNREKNPKVHVTVEKKGSGSVKLSSTSIERGKTIEVFVTPGKGCEVAEFNAYMENKWVPSYQLEQNKWIVPNTYLDVTVAISFKNKKV